MKKFSIIIVLGLLALSFNSFSQLRVDSNGNATVKYGSFSSGNDAVMYLGDTNHYIKGVFGYGVKIGTAGAADVIRVKQYDARVGINRDPSYMLDVDGTIQAYNTLYHSDQRCKEDIQDLDNPLEKLKQVKGVSYKFINADKGAKNNENNKNFGFIAQDFRKIYPELVYEDSKGYLSIDYVSMIPVLLEAFKTQQTRLDGQQAQIGEQQSQIGKQQAQIEALQKAVDKLTQKN